MWVSGLSVCLTSIYDVIRTICGSLACPLVSLVSIMLYANLLSPDDGSYIKIIINISLFLMKYEIQKFIIQCDKLLPFYSKATQGTVVI